MGLTKDEVSNLKSLQAAVTARTIDQYKAAQQLSEAEGKLSSYLWELEHPKKEEGK